MHLFKKETVMYKLTRPSVQPGFVSRKRFSLSQPGSTLSRSATYKIKSGFSLQIRQMPITIILNECTS